MHAISIVHYIWKKAFLALIALLENWFFTMLVEKGLLMKETQGWQKLQRVHYIILSALERLGLRLSVHLLSCLLCLPPSPPFFLHFKTAIIWAVDPEVAVQLPLWENLRYAASFLCVLLDKCTLNLLFCPDYIKCSLMDWLGNLDRGGHSALDKKVVRKLFPVLYALEWLLCYMCLGPISSQYSI